MGSYVTPKKNAAYVFYVGLESQTTPGTFQANPTLAAGDVKVAVDDAAPGNLATLPVVDADFTRRVKVSLSADEMNGDNVTVIFADAAGAEWYDLIINIQTTARQVDDLLPTSSYVETPALVSGRMPSDVQAISGDTTAADNLEAMLDGTGGVELKLKKLTVNNPDALGVGIQVNAYNGAHIEGTNRGVTLQGGGNQALYMLSDTAAATVYIEGPTTGGKGLMISSPSDGSSLPGASGIFIQTENGHPGILFDFTDPADVLKVINSDNGAWVLDDKLFAMPADTADAVRAELATELAHLDEDVSAGAHAGDAMALVDDAITAAKFDQSTAHPLAQADTGSTAVARTGADADTLKTLSDQVDGVGGSGLTAQETRDAMKLAPSAGAAAAGSIDAHLDSLLAYGAGTGTGTYTDTVTDGVDPLDNVLVQLSTDSAGANMAYRAYTGADGVFVMSPDPGTYYVWFELAGYSFTQGAEVVVT